MKLINRVRLFKPRATFTKITFLKILMASFLGASTAVAAADKPNIVFILADDMGYGDVQAYNRKSKIPTPNINMLAEQGMKFTDAHTSSAVCTPSRYSIITGRYAWRSTLKKGVTWGYSPLLIDTSLSTLPSMLQENGYHTAAIGKWHLGLGQREPDFFGPSADTGKFEATKYSGLTPGPNDVGFDYFYGIPASLDMKPYLYIENDKPYSPLTGKLVPASDFKRSGGGGFWRVGQVAEGFVHEDVLPNITRRALSYIDERAKAKQPFFLYFALTAPHTPWLATKEFQGSSKAGHYGDFAVQVDDVVGQLNKKLKALGLSDNTIFIYTSDNGAHWMSSDIEQFDHLANGNLRGQKADIHEAGHRVPFLVQWPDKIKPGSVSDKQVVLTDLYATFADIVGKPLTDNNIAKTGADSVSFAPALHGQAKASERAVPLIHHSLTGMFAIRLGDWKLIEGLGTGGFTNPAKLMPKKGQQPYQLYNLKTDPSESDNLADKRPDMVKKLVSLLEQARAKSHTRS